MTAPVFPRILAFVGGRWEADGQCVAGEWPECDAYVREEPVEELRDAVEAALADLDGLAKRGDVAARLRAALAAYPR